MSAHTPAPWEVVKNYGDGRLYVMNLRRHLDGGDICKVGDEPEAEANARLIAAAPDMHDALRQFVAGLEAVKFDVFIGTPSEYKTLADARTAALAALAKAEGKS